MKAHAKLNLVLRVGTPRPDGLHELASIFASIDLADEVSLEPADRDEVICPGIDGLNLAEVALERFRYVTGAAPMRVTIEKRIPIAAGLAGGSADAAAVLRGANEVSGAGLSDGDLRELGGELGADVPSQIDPRHAIVTGVGERVRWVELPQTHVVLVPDPEGLSTAAVYAEADRIESTRANVDPGGLTALAALPLPRLAAAMENDLEPAAISLRPELEPRIAALAARPGCLGARITGSGPTVFGLFQAESDALAAAASTPGALVARFRE